MATGFIDMDDTKFLGRANSRAMKQLRDARRELEDSLSVFTQMVDGNGSDVTHFQLLVTEGIYTSTAHAKASWDELQSLNYAIEQAEAAILQACAKHGI